MIHSPLFAHGPDAAFQLVSHLQNTLVHTRWVWCYPTRSVSTIQQPAGLSICLILKRERAWSWTQKRINHSQVVMFQNTLYPHSFECHLHFDDSQIYSISSPCHSPDHISSGLLNSSTWISQSLHVQTELLIVIPKPTPLPVFPFSVDGVTTVLTLT